MTKKTTTTVQISVEQNQRLAAICHRTGISKKRVVRTLLDFALPTYEQATPIGAGGDACLPTNPAPVPTMTPAVAIGTNATGANACVPSEPKP